MITLGVDVHKKYSQVAALNEQGKITMNLKMPNEKRLFSELLSELNEPCQAVIESGYCWGIMFDMLTDLGVDVTVAHALKVKAIASAKIKTDKIDAKTLAELLKANLIPEVHVPCRDVRQQKDLLRQRCWLNEAPRACTWYQHLYHLRWSGIPLHPRACPWFLMNTRLR